MNTIAIAATLVLFALGWNLWLQQREISVLQAAHPGGTAANGGRPENRPMKGRISEDGRVGENKAAPPQTVPDSRHDPVYGVVWRQKLIRGVEAGYGDLLALLNLPSDKLRRLKELLVDRVMNTEDAADAARRLENGGATTVLAAVAKAGDEAEDSIRALLGDEDYARFQDVSRLSGSYSLIRSTYMPELEDAGCPLTQDQAIALARALYYPLNAETLSQRDSLTSQFDPQTGLTAWDQRTLGAASTVLSQPQLGIVEKELSLSSRFYHRSAKGRAAGAR